MDKAAAFIGRDALARQREAGIRKRLVLFTFDDAEAFPWGGEPILMDGCNVGELTSAGYSRKHGRAIAMGYARAGAAEPPLSDARILAARYAIDIAGTHVRGDAAPQARLNGAAVTAQPGGMRSLFAASHASNVSSAGFSARATESFRASMK